MDDKKMPIELDTIIISFLVCDHDRLFQNTYQTIVTVGKHVSSELGKKHWDEMVKFPCQQISFWHPIQSVKKAERQNIPLPSISLSSDRMSC